LRVAAVFATLECRWLLEKRAKTVNPATARAPLDYDPLGEFDAEPTQPAPRREAPRVVPKTPSPPVVTPRGPEWGPLSALVLAILQVPLVGLWLGGVPSPLARTVGTATVPTPQAVANSSPVRQTGPAFSPISKVPETVIADPGVLHVETQPARVRVLVDGTYRGRSPLTLTGLANGSHTVAARFGTREIERDIDLQPGRTFSLVLSGPDEITATGAVSVDASIPLQVYRDGDLVGSSDTGVLVLPAGDHTLDIRDDRLGFRVRRAVRVRSGGTTPLRIDLPRAPISIEAQPPVEVWIDGTPVGMTPLSSLTSTIGRHQVRVRHPELGERTAMLLVTLDEPARLAFDLRQP
jgi:hypothetical protein